MLFIPFLKRKFLAEILTAYLVEYLDTKVFKLLARTLSAAFTSTGMILPFLSCTTKSSSPFPLNSH